MLPLSRLFVSLSRRGHLQLLDRFYYCSLDSGVAPLPVRAQKRTFRGEQTKGTMLHRTFHECSGLVSARAGCASKQSYVVVCRRRSESSLGRVFASLWW